MCLNSRVWLPADRFGQGSGPVFSSIANKPSVTSIPSCVCVSVCDLVLVCFC